MKRISTVLVAATCTLLCSAAAVHAVDTTWGVALDGSYLAPLMMLHPKLEVLLLPGCAPVWFLMETL